MFIHGTLSTLLRLDALTMDLEEMKREIEQLVLDKGFYNAPKGHT